MSWFVIVLASGALFLLFGFLLYRESKLTAPLLGLLTLGSLFFLIGIFKPAYIKYNGAELPLEKRIERIEKDLREYAVVSHKGIVHNTFKFGRLSFVSFKAGEEGWPTLKFTLDAEPDYVEVRGDQGRGILESAVKNGKIEYTYKLRSIYTENSPDKIYQEMSFLIEAYYR